MRRFSEFNIDSFSNWNNFWDMTLFVSYIEDYEFSKGDMRDWLFS